MNKNLKKILIVIFSTILLVEISNVFLMWKNLADKEINNNLINKDNKEEIFALMLEQEDSTYQVSDLTVWPTNMKYNRELSKCMDKNGEIIENVLSYDEDTNIAILETNKTAFCYLYFDIKESSISGEDSKNSSINVSIDEGTYPVTDYCVNTSVTDTSSCTWKEVTGMEFEVPISETNTYYIHIKNTKEQIYSSTGVNVTVLTGSFGITVSAYQTVKINNISTNANNYKIKYASGNQEPTYFSSSGTDITSGLSFTASSAGIYTIALLSSDNKVITTQKVYIHNFGSSTTKSRSANVTLSGVTQIIGSAFTHTGSATATLSGTKLSLTARSGSYYSRSCDKYNYTCPYGTVSGTKCTGSDYYVETVMTYDCVCTYPYACTKTGESGNLSAKCPTGWYRGGYYTDSGFPSSAGASCSSSDSFSWSRTMVGECVWEKDFDATKGSCNSYTYYYRYTVGVIVK